MQRGQIRTIFVWLVAQVLLVASSAAARDHVTELVFAQPSMDGSDTVKTLHSLVKVQGSGGLYQDGLYLITQVGGRDSLFARENQKTIASPWREQTWRYCSQFVTHVGGSTVMGRNWDNQNVGSIIVSVNRPPDRYASISFSRAIDIGFPLNLDLEQVVGTELGTNLLLAPFYATDGINERGLTIAIAGVNETTHETPERANLIFVTNLVRLLLDRAATVDDAVSLAQQYVPFDLDRNSLNSHFLIADSSGHAAVLEYTDHWSITYGDGTWQVMTNKPVSEAADAELRDRCWRYRTITDRLADVQGRVDWRTGLDILRDAAQAGTTWSVVYSPSAKDLHFTVYQNWDTVYHVERF